MSSFRPLWLVPALVLILQGCASVPAEPPKIERMTAAELEARLPQPVAALPPEQIVVLVRQGIGAEEIIGRITQSGSRYRLSATRIVELAQQGVQLPVLDHMVSAERTQIFDDMAAEAHRQELACQERLAQEINLRRSQAMMPMWSPWPHAFVHCFP